MNENIIFKRFLLVNIYIYIYNNIAKSYNPLISSEITVSISFSSKFLHEYL